MSKPRKARRHRGPITDWKPQRRTRELIADVQAILDEYRDYWPMSVRAVYYRLLGTGKYAKGKRLADRVGDHIGNARRAGVIPWEAISDENVTRLGGGGWESADQWLDFHDLYEQAERFRLDRQAGQPQQLLVWCEARGMTSMLSDVADEYGVEVISRGGYDSTTIRHEIGESAGDLDVPLVVLHIGDLDPDGGKIYRALAEDVIAWAEDEGGEVEFLRLAVTEEQANDPGLNLAHDPDRRGWVQAEAIPPDVMAGILRSAISERLDERAFADVLANEREQRQGLLDRFRPEES